MKTERFCKFCNTSHLLTEAFWRRLDRGPICKVWEKEYSRQHYLANKEKRTKQIAAWSEANKEKKKKYQETWKKKYPEKVAALKKRHRIKHREKYIEKNKQYYQENKTKRAAYLQLRRECPEFRLAENVRRRIHHGLFFGRGIKSDSTLTLLGCSFSALRSHLESLFQPGMSWDNYGFYGWHIDHIRPLASFDLTDPAQQKQAFHYTNLQPLWAADNRAKWDTWEERHGS